MTTSIIVALCLVYAALTPAGGAFFAYTRGREKGRYTTIDAEFMFLTFMCAIGWPISVPILVVYYVGNWPGKDFVLRWARRGATKAERERDKERDREQQKADPDPDPQPAAGINKL